MKFTKSIRWRLLFWLALILVCILAGFGVTAYQLNRLNRLNQLDEELKSRVATVSADFRGRIGPGRWDFPRDKMDREGPPEFPREKKDHDGPPEFPHEKKDREGRPPFEGPGPGPRGEQPAFKPDLLAETLSLFNPADSNGFYFAIWSGRGTLLKSSANAPGDVPFPEQTEGDTRIQTRTRDTFREAYHFTERGHCILVGRSMLADLGAVHRFAWLLLAAGGAILAVGLGGGWVLAERAIRPVEEISAAASRISAGNLAERINVAETDSELGRLAGVLNSTFARLEAAFAEQKQFTADASHELRTPLAVLISEAQTALRRERTPAEYQETIQACLDTSQQMRRLTESLLQLARFDAGQELLQRTRFDLAESARSTVDLLRPLAAERQIQVHCELASAPIQGDEDSVRQVITNLLTNAIQYNHDGGRISLAVSQDTLGAVLTVRDTGPGIAPDDLPHIFQRFYRGDKARAGANGRSGLGLAICKAIIEAHGGNIEAASQPGAGAAFTVRFPKSG